MPRWLSDFAPGIKTNSKEFSGEIQKKKKKKKIHRGQFQSIFHEEAKQKLQDIYLDHFH